MLTNLTAPTMTAPVRHARPALRVYTPGAVSASSSILGSSVAAPKARESLPCSPAWVRMSGIDRRSVPFTGHGDVVRPYLGWLLRAFDIDFEEVDSTDGCYLIAYAYGEPPYRQGRDSVMFVLYREHGVDGFYVMDGYDAFTPDQCVAEIQANAKNYTALDVSSALAAIGEMLYLPNGTDYSSVMMRAWNSLSADLEYWHGKDRGPWDWK